MADPIEIRPPVPLPDAPPVPQRDDPATFEERNDAGYEFVFEQLPSALERLEGNVFQNAKATEQLALAADASATAAAESERKAGDSETVVLEAKGQTERARDDAIEAKEGAEAIANKFGDVDAAVTLTTEQAGIATTKAGEATNKAAAADAAATRAEQAKDAAAVLSSQYKVFLTKEDMDADRNAAAGRTAMVIEDPNPALNGSYYKIGASGTGSWEWLRNQPAINSALDSLRVNSGKAFPLRAATRAGITSAPGPYWQGVMLKVVVTGPETDMQGKVYRIGYFQNGATVGGVAANGIVLEEFDAATYATSDASMVRIHTYTDEPAAYDRSKGGIQSFSIVPALRRNLRFDVTIDVSALPPQGTPLNSYSNSENPAWSWIVDPSCYVIDRKLVDDLTINQGRSLPLRRMTRNGITSPRNSVWDDVILDAKVNMARKGEYYRIAYQQNGALLDGERSYDWIIEAFDAATYGTASSPITLLSYEAAYGPQQQIDRNAGIQTIHLYPPSRPGMRIDITLDASRLPNVGIAINSWSPNTRDAWSWIIDPSRYELEPAPNPDLDVGGRFDISSVETTFSSESAGKAYRIAMGPNGFNDLPNVRSLYAGPSMGDISTYVTGGSTDFLNPYTVRALANGDGGAVMFTGGNHGSGGNASGNRTARNLLYRVMPDGRPLSAPASGRAGGISALIVNEVMAYNTISLGRHVLRTTTRLYLTPGSLEIECLVLALEDVEIQLDYGPQAVVQPWSGGTMMFVGKSGGRIPFATGISSGAKSENPDVWALVVNDPVLGQWVSWVDREYEAGDGRYVSDGQPYINLYGNKAYHSIVRYPSGGGATLLAGQSYRWRGGYAWQADGLQPAGIDSFFTFTRGGVPATAWVLPDGSSTIV